MKKASRAVIPPYSHTLWLEEQDSLSQEWEDIQGLFQDVFELVPEAEYADDPEDYNVRSVLENIVSLLQDVKTK